MIRHDTSTQVWDGGVCSWGSRKPGPAERARAQQMEGPFALKGQEQGRRRAGERSSVSCAPAPRAGGGGGLRRTAGKAHAAAPCHVSSRFCESPAAETRKFSAYRQPRRSRVGPSPSLTFTVTKLLNYRLQIGQPKVLCDDDSNLAAMASHHLNTSTCSPPGPEYFYNIFLGAHQVIEVHILLKCQELIADLLCLLQSRRTCQVAANEDKKVMAVATMQVV